MKAGADSAMTQFFYNADAYFYFAALAPPVAILVFVPAIRRSHRATDPLSGVDPPPSSLVPVIHQDQRRDTIRRVVAILALCGACLITPAEHPWLWLASVTVGAQTPDSAQASDSARKPYELQKLFSGDQPPAAPNEGEPRPTDRTLQDPRCVFQVLKRHFSRYTPEMVEQVCGVPAAQFLAVADALCDNSGRERTAAICYSVGWTQHTVGAQIIRTAAIIQLLLGNVGRPGGGIMALRGHASIQGSTDIPTLYNLLPGYLPMAHAGRHADLAQYVEATTAGAGLWGHAGAYIVSLLKAWWGDAAQPDLLERPRLLVRARVRERARLIARHCSLSGAVGWPRRLTR